MYCDTEDSTVKQSSLYHFIAALTLQKESTVTKIICYSHSFMSYPKFTFYLPNSDESWHIFLIAPIWQMYMWCSFGLKIHMHVWNIWYFLFCIAFLAYALKHTYLFVMGRQQTDPDFWPEGQWYE